MRITVAMAFDEAFNCYFPAGLDLLELRGATVVDFSPLRDAALPPDTDIVFLGCGHPERYATPLADNHCMMSALRDHVRWGHRLYAEGGGLAYLCEQMETSDGATVPMAGVFPATARLDCRQSDFQPIEVTLPRANWLGPLGPRSAATAIRAGDWSRSERCRASSPTRNTRTTWSARFRPSAACCT